MPFLLVIPLACGTHIAVDAAIFGAPVGMVLLTIFALNRWGPQDD
jgi:hypothetical protein